MILKRNYKSFKSVAQTVTLICILIILPVVSYAQQRISFGIHADPIISWFSTDNSKVKNDGARPGFGFGMTFNRYFTQNYSFSTGISLVNAGGRLTTSDATVMNFSSSNPTVPSGIPVVYKIQYLVFPVGLKFQTNQIGYFTFFSDLGLDPKIVVRRKVDIPSLGISNEDASKELRLYNLSYHIEGGIEYSLGGTTALVFGLHFDNNFVDITKDNGDQPSDNVSHKMLSFRFGINF